MTLTAAPLLGWAGLDWTGLTGAWEGICDILGLTSDQSIQDTEDTDTNTAHWETALPPIHLTNYSFQLCILLCFDFI